MFLLMGAVTKASTRSFFMSATALSKASKAAFPASSVDIPCSTRMSSLVQLMRLTLLGWASSTALMMLKLMDGKSSILR